MMKLKNVNEFDLIQNTKTIFKTLDQKRSFNDYVDAAARIYLNYKRSGLTTSQFNEKTKISKNILICLGNLKKQDGHSWSDLIVKVNSIEQFINENIKELNNCIELLQKCPIENGYRVYNDSVLDVICPLVPKNNPHDFLNIIGFDIGQFDKCSSKIQNTQIVKKDVQKARKIKAQQLTLTFKNNPIVIAIKGTQFQEKIQPKLALHIVSEYRKLLIEEPTYTFKQFCIDCNIYDRFKSLNYYHINFDKAKEKFNKSPAGIA